MEFKFAPLKQNTVRNVILARTRSHPVSVSLATRGFMTESWREGGIAQSQKVEENYCISEYIPFISDGAQFTISG